MCWSEKCLKHKKHNKKKESKNVWLAEIFFHRCRKSKLWTPGPWMSQMCSLACCHIWASWQGFVSCHQELNVSGSDQCCWIDWRSASNELIDTYIVITNGLKYMRDLIDAQILTCWYFFDTLVLIKRQNLTFWYFCDILELILFQTW